MINAGRYDKRIKIVRAVKSYSPAGFPTTTRETVLEPYARVRTTKGWTLISSGSDFEAATTNFTIRTPATVAIDRDMLIEYAGKTYTIEYINNIDEAGVELELQAREITH